MLFHKTAKGWRFSGTCEATENSEEGLVWVCVGLGNRGEKTRGPLSFLEKNLGMDILVPGTKNLCGSATGNTESVSGDSPNSQGPLSQCFWRSDLYIQIPFPTVRTKLYT